MSLLGHLLEQLAETPGYQVGFTAGYAAGAAKMREDILEAGDREGLSADMIEGLPLPTPEPPA